MCWKNRKKIDLFRTFFTQKGIFFTLYGTNYHPVFGLPILTFSQISGIITLE